MRTLSVLAALFLTLLVAPGAATAQDDVKAVEAEWARALVAADVATLSEIYADDLVYVHSNGSVDTKEEWLDLIGTGRIDFSSAIPRSTQVRVYGNSAVVNALYDSVLNDRPMAIQYLTVFVKDEARWRIVTQQTATLPDAGR